MIYFYQLKILFHNKPYKCIFVINYIFIYFLRYYNFKKIKLNQLNL